MPRAARRNVSANPSPPSESGQDTVCGAGDTRDTPSAAAAQACTAVNEPLNESKARMIFILLFYFRQD